MHNWWYRERIEELEMIWDEYKDLYLLTSTENAKFCKDIADIEKAKTKFEKDCKKKDKIIKENKGIQEKLKQAEKRITQMVEAGKDTKEDHTQTLLEQTIKATMTEFTIENIKDMERKAEEMDKEHEKLESKIRILEEEIKIGHARRIAGTHSNNESERHLSPKYKSRVEIEVSEFEENTVIEENKKLEHEGEQK